MVKDLPKQMTGIFLQMYPCRTASDGDRVGRQTGSLAWRLARGELGQPAATQFVLLPTSQVSPLSTQSAGPVRFLILCSISISLLASLVSGRRPQCNAGAD
jgi:hypothetical protein